MNSGARNLHGTGLVIEGYGILLRGPSGAGKSLLALELLDFCTGRALPASLVADDRIDLFVRQGELVLSAPPTIAGRIELRGRGIVRRDYQASARLDLVVDFLENPARMGEDDDFITELAGISIARCPVPHRAHGDSAHQRLLIFEALDALKQSALSNGSHL